MVDTQADPIAFPPSLGHDPRQSADLASQPVESIRPIRRDYDSDSDDEAELVYVSTAAPPRNRPRHQSTPSTSALLSPDEEAAGVVPQLAQAPRQARLREYSSEVGGAGWTAPWWLRPIVDRLEGARAFVKRNEGFLLIALAQSLFATINCCVKLLQDLVAIPVWQLIAIRMGITYIGCILYMKWAKTPHPYLGPPGVRLLLCARGVVGFGGLYGMYNSLKYLSLSDATVLSFISPVLVGVLAAILLKEKYTKVEALTGVLSLGGVLLIAKPSFLFGKGTGGEVSGPGNIPVTPEERASAVGTAMIGVVGSAGAYLIIRTIGKRANALHSISYFSLYSVIVSCIYPLVVHSPPVFIWDYRFILLITPIGVLGFAAQALLTMGLQREKAGRGTLAVYSLLLFSTFFERVVFGKLPDAWSIVGSIIIIGGALYVVVQKKDDSAAKRPVRKSAIVSLPVSETDAIKLEEGRNLRESEDDEDDEDDEDSAGVVRPMPSAGGSGER